MKKTFWTFIKGIHCEGPEYPESAKRFYGGIGFIVAAIYIALWNHSLIEVLLITSATMITGGAILNTIQSYKNKPVADNTEEKPIESDQTKTE